MPAASASYLRMWSQPHSGRPEIVATPTPRARPVSCAHSSGSSCRNQRPEQQAARSQPLRAGSGCAAAAALTLLLSCQPASVAAGAGDVLLGVPRIIDGDTVEVAGTRSRLFAIDAPETKQLCERGGQQYACGLEAKEALQQKVGGREVFCEVRGTDRYGRSVATCSLVGGRVEPMEDLNGWMVREGHAVAYRQYSKKYVPLEEEARAERRGIWAGTFQEPQQWRAGQRGGGGDGAILAYAPPLAGPAPAPAPDQPGCAIKGNISSRGERIYHVPGSRSYEQTVIDPAAGERWFCSEEDAVQAGWRKAN